MLPSQQSEIRCITRTVGLGSHPRPRETLEVLAQVEQDLNNVVQGLSLLGVRRCSQCGRFFCSSDPGALFGGTGELICLECIPSWWPTRREQLTYGEREKTEGNLVIWLRGRHKARSGKSGEKLRAKQPVKFELIATCIECHGTGT